MRETTRKCRYHHRDQPARISDNDPTQRKYLRLATRVLPRLLDPPDRPVRAGRPERVDPLSWNRCSQWGRLAFDILSAWLHSPAPDPTGPTV